MIERSDHRLSSAALDVFGRRVYMCIIARRSRFFAGARFLKRGANDAVIISQLSRLLATNFSRAMLPTMSKRSKSWRPNSLHRSTRLVPDCTQVQITHPLFNIEVAYHCTGHKTTLVSLPNQTSRSTSLILSSLLLLCTLTIFLKDMVRQSVC